jgi:hypothetical protein
MRQLGLLRNDRLFNGWECRVEWFYEFVPCHFVVWDLLILCLFFIVLKGGLKGSNYS